jgi:hypothetical protein
MSSQTPTLRAPIMTNVDASLVDDINVPDPRTNRISGEPINVKVYLAKLQM